MADEADLANDSIEKEDVLRRMVMNAQPRMRRIGQCYNCEESFLTTAEAKKLKTQIAQGGGDFPDFEPTSQKLFCDCECERDYTKRQQHQNPRFLNS